MKGTTISRALAVSFFFALPPAAGAVSITGGGLTATGIASSQLGAIGQGIGLLLRFNTQILAWRFTIDTPFLATGPDGHIGGAGDFFFWIEKLSGPGALLQGDPFAASEPDATSPLFTLAGGNSVLVAQSLPPFLLDAGTYAFGIAAVASGDLGFMPQNSTDFTGAEYLFWSPKTATGGGWQPLVGVGGLHFSIEGQFVPEPGCAALAALACAAGLAAARRRRSRSNAR